MRVFGIDPGSVRTGYGCVESDGSRHRLVDCGALASPAGAALPARLHSMHARLLALIRRHAPDCVVVENLFHARNVRSALVLGHARGVAVLAAMQAGAPVLEYTPAEVKLAVVGYGRAEKAQMQQMVKMLLGLDTVPSPHDAADALAIAICHLQSQGPIGRLHAAAGASGRARSWRHVRPADLPRRPIQ
jgi:crossover junction endodeoxyribonuclease RuvC